MWAKLDFLVSRKFWCLIVIAILGVLQQQEILPANIVSVFVGLLYGYIGINVATMVATAIAPKK